MIRIGILDDHQLFVKSLGMLIDSINGCEVVVDALSGQELIGKLRLPQHQPEVLLIDVNMPEMDGPQVAAIVGQNYPQIKMVALSMKADDQTILRMLRAGCSAYLLKDIHPSELEKAIFEIDKKGYYNADACNLNFRRLLLQRESEPEKRFSQRELTFLQLACSDLTYKEIASSMVVSERTVDGYRDSLFQKLSVQSRVGMALEAIRLNLVHL
jgi:DNA-binding NarL/FixJ family response regulator